MSSNADRKTSWLVTGREAVKLEKLVYRLLSVADQHKPTLKQMLDSLPADLRERLLKYFIDLQEKGLVTFNRPGDPVGARRRCVRADQRVLCRGKASKLTPAWKLEHAPATSSAGV